MELVSSIGRCSAQKPKGGEETKRKGHRVFVSLSGAWSLFPEPDGRLMGEKKKENDKWNKNCEELRIGGVVEQEAIPKSKSIPEQCSGIVCLNHLIVPKRKSAFGKSD
ncbi:hypothetical protein H6P81_010703 [Aristolochia fimbriata]|uniref:Uncharacterized protein n=1 Tax=Aristolochia fimbriata TaxID=158543 RepID=A0AAV7ETY6_ARIFI|nr:hypothetical protein H6P81_010703 [Aristolochia fimbriata]